MNNVEVELFKYRKIMNNQCNYEKIIKKKKYYKKQTKNLMHVFLLYSDAM